MSFELPPLPYDYGALEPHIDTQTMQIHHDKHWKAPLAWRVNQLTRSCPI
jgi:superoxide dismutase